MQISCYSIASIRKIRVSQFVVPEVERLSENIKNAHHGAGENNLRPASRLHPALQHHVRRKLFGGEAKARLLQEPESGLEGRESGQQER